MRDNVQVGTQIHASALNCLTCQPNPQCTYKTTKVKCYLQDELKFFVYI